MRSEIQLQSFSFLNLKQPFQILWCLYGYSHISSVQFSSVVQSCPTLCNTMDCMQHTRFPCPLPTPELVQTHVHWISDCIQPSHPLSSPSPSIFPSISVFSNESVLCIRWPKDWSFNFSISPSSLYIELPFKFWCSFVLWLNSNRYKLTVGIAYRYKKFLSHFWHKSPFFTKAPFFTKTFTLKFSMIANSLKKKNLFLCVCVCFCTRF